MSDETEAAEPPAGPSKGAPPQQSGVAGSPAEAPAHPSEGPGLAQAGSVDPQKLLRIAGVTREVLEEARRIRPDAGAVDHLNRVHDVITKELHEALPEQLYEELDELTPDIRHGTLEELALAHAEILGWLEGLFQGTQLAIQLQAARALGEQSPRRLPPASEEDPERGLPDSRYL